MVTDDEKVAGDDMTPHQVEAEKLANAVQWRQEDLALRRQAHDDLMRILERVTTAMEAIAIAGASQTDYDAVDEAVRLNISDGKLRARIVDNVLMAIRGR